MYFFGNPGGEGYVNGTRYFRFGLRIVPDDRGRKRWAESLCLEENAAGERNVCKVCFLLLW